ncbi:MAG: hypothetical protein JWM32_2620 [Verrucomicrobia bacterium]|nr:hypothetical protein [Verrucomicrobiota bacterium]
MITVLSPSLQENETSSRDPMGFIAWRPPMNVFRCDGHIAVCVDLAGAEEGSIEVSVKGRHLIIRGNRQPVEPTDEPLHRVLALEIDHGPFERILTLTEAVEASGLMTEQRGGLFWIRLPLAPSPSPVAA